MWKKPNVATSQILSKLFPTINYVKYTNDFVAMTKKVYLKKNLSEFVK